MVKVGDRFNSFADAKKAIEELGGNTYTTFWKRDARTLASCKVVRPIESCLMYYQLLYACNHGGKKFKSSGKKIRQSWTLKEDCPVHVRFKASSDGKALEVTSVQIKHNHVTMSHGVLDEAIDTHMISDLPIEQVDVGSTSFEETTDPDLDLLPESDEPSLPKQKRTKDMKIYCRLCLNPSNKNQMVCFGDFHDINYPSRSEQFKRNKILQTEMYLRMIRTVMPNFNHDLVYNPIMCNGCSTRLQMASDFIEQCMATQNLIQQYKDRYCPAEKLVSCEDVVHNRCLLLPLPQNNQAVPSNPKKRRIDKPIPQQPTETVSYNEDFQTLENVNVKTEQFEEMQNELKYEITPEEVCTIKQEFVEEETMIKTEESEITLPVDRVVKSEPCSTEISDYNIVATEQTSIKQFSNIDPIAEVDSIYNTNYLVGVPHVPAQFCPPTLPARYCPPNQPVASETFVSLVNPVTTPSVASNNVDLSFNFQNNQNR